MDLITLGRTLGFSFAAGVNLYATVAILGLAARYGWVELPPQFQVFNHDVVIGAAIVMYLIEFFADKIPYLDSLWDLPAIFICENNGYGMGTAVSRASAVANLSARGTAYDMPEEAVDGQDVFAVLAAVERAVSRARKDSLPTLLEIRTYRYVGHSMSDAAHGTYRTREEVEEYRRRDPIRILADRMKAGGLLDDAAMEALEAEVREEVEDAYRFADESPDPEPSALYTDVYADGGAPA